MDRPQVGGYGYGIGMPIFGSWGWTPFSLFGPGPNVAESFQGLSLKAIVFFMFFGAAAALLRKYFTLKVEDEEEDENEDAGN